MLLLPYNFRLNSLRNSIKSVAKTNFQIQCLIIVIEGGSGSENFHSWLLKYHDKTLQMLSH